MAKSGYDEKTFDAYEDMLEMREYAKEQLQKIAVLLGQNAITYEEAIKRIQYDYKSVDLAKWKYKQEISKICVEDLFKEAER